MKTEKWSAEVKLSYIHGLLKATLGSVCDYSVAALKDRMEFIAAVIEDDGSGQEHLGQICFKEQREQHPEIFAPESLEPVQ